MNKNSDYIA